MSKDSITVLLDENPSQKAHTSSANLRVKQHAGNTIRRSCNQARSGRVAVDSLLFSVFFVASSKQSMLVFKRSIVFRDEPCSDSAILGASMFI